MNNDQKFVQQRREKPEPYEQSRPVPALVLTVIGIMFVWAVWYLFNTYNPMPSELGDNRVSADFMVPVSVDGGQLYTANCIACHQATGAGVPGVFPPLGNSEWVTSDPGVTVRIVLHGVHGPLTVDGTTYNGDMPPFEDKFSDAEVAAVINHIRTSFGNSASEIDAELVARVREETKDQTTPWKGDEDLGLLLKD